MRREVWHLTCSRKNFINLKNYAHQIIMIVKRYGGKNVVVNEKDFSFDWSYRRPMTTGQKISMGKSLAKIKGLGCYVDVYHYTRRNTNTSAVSRRLFRAA